MVIAIAHGIWIRPRQPSGLHSFEVRPPAAQGRQAIVPSVGPGTMRVVSG